MSSYPLDGEKSGLVRNPGRLEHLISPDFEGWVILDEVQRIPALLNEVHRLIESRKLRFVLTGSSARSLRRNGVNLLAGRAHCLAMHPLTVKELGDDFQLDHSLRYGHLPMAQTDPSPDAYLSAYVGTYLQEEVLHEGLTRNLGAFARFLETASFSQGAPLNLTAIARECAVNRKLVSSYFDLVEDLLLGSRLPVFTKRAQRKLVSHPKFYLFDVGVFRSLRPMGPLDRPEEAQRAALETLFYQEIRALNDYLGYEHRFYYWRTSGGLEVDFVAYGPRGIYAFEIKRSSYIHNRDLKALRAFGADYPTSKQMLLYGGNREMWMDDIRIIPFEQALQDLATLM